MNRESEFLKDFATIDANGDGTLTREEYIKAFNTRHAEQGDPDWFPNYEAHKERLLQSLLREFDAFDADGNGTVSREEYVALRHEQAAASDDMRWFLALDKDASGYLSVEDVQISLEPGPDGKLTQEQEIGKRLLAAIRLYDVDGDGKVWMDEFLDGQRQGRARARQARAKA